MNTVLFVVKVRIDETYLHTAPTESEEDQVHSMRMRLVLMMSMIQSSEHLWVHLTS